MSLCVFQTLPSPPVQWWPCPSLVSLFMFSVLAEGTGMCFNFGMDDLERRAGHFPSWGLWTQHQGLVNTGSLASLRWQCLHGSFQGREMMTGSRSWCLKSSEKEGHTQGNGIVQPRWDKRDGGTREEREGRGWPRRRACDPPVQAVGSQLATALSWP